MSKMDHSKIYTKPKSLQKNQSFQLGDFVRITKYKNIFEKGFTPNWTRELFVVKERLDTNPWTYKIEDTQGQDVYGTFYEQELQKSRAKLKI